MRRKVTVGRTKENEDLHSGVGLGGYGEILGMMNGKRRKGVDILYESQWRKWRNRKREQVYE